jgi:hypothetical protein
MKKALIIVGVVLLFAGFGFYYYYDNHLRFTDGFTDCPVAAFRDEATSESNAVDFITEDNLVSLKVTERCSIDCKGGNTMACVLYGLAQYEGVFVIQGEKEAVREFEKACKKGEAFACQIKDKVGELKLEREKSAREKDIKKAREAQRQEVERAQTEVSKVIKRAVAYFKGNPNASKTDSMLNWYAETIQYLLYDKPALSRMHPGSTTKGDDLETFVMKKYVTGKDVPSLPEIEEFFDKIKRLGVMQIRLDYRVEKKKESEIKKGHDYFRAKYSFLYHAGNTELKVLEAL